MNTLILCGLFAFLGIVHGFPAPEPQQQYRQSVHPYYYGYPGQSSYVYRASLEDDDEEAAPTVVHLQKVASKKTTGRERATKEGRQEQQTGSDSESSVPVLAEKQPDSPASGQPPKVAKPLTSSSLSNSGVVNPPVFPPKRPPPTAAPIKEKEKVTDEDEDEEDEDDDEAATEEEDDEEDEDEEEDDEERRRNENVKETLTAVTDSKKGVNTTLVVESQVSNKTESTKTKTSKPVKSTVKVSKNKNKNKQVVVESNVDQSDSVEGVEALVPGYITDQGEVLVPVDTVTGSKPISIVPDPYSPLARGVPLRNAYRQEGIFSLQNHGVPLGNAYRQEDFGNDDDDDVTLENEAGTAEDEEDDAEDAEDDDDDKEDEEDEAEKPEKGAPKTKPKPPKQPKVPKEVPLAFLQASAPTREDDEWEAAQRYRSGVFGVDQRRFPPSRSPVLYPITFQVNGGYLTGPFNEPVDSAEVSQYTQPQVVRRAPQQYQQQRPRRPVVPFRRPAQPQQSSVYGSPFYSSPYGQYVQSSMEQVGYRRRQPAVGYPSVGGYNYSPSPYNSQVRLYTRRPYFGPRTSPYNSVGPIINSVEDYLPPRNSFSKLRNPGDRLKISSSYEVLVEPQDFTRVRTKTKRPSNKKRVVVKRPVVPLTTQVYAQRPVQVLPVRPQQQFQRPQTPVFYRPVYNVEPQQRVTVTGSLYRPQPLPAPSAYPVPIRTQPGQVSYQTPNIYKDFIKGILSGYYGNGRPTPVIRMKNDLPLSFSSASSSSSQEADDSSASGSGSSEMAVPMMKTETKTKTAVSPMKTPTSRAERNSRKTRLEKKNKTNKKTKKSKKVRDPLNILKKISSHKTTNM